VLRPLVDLLAFGLVIATSAELRAQTPSTSSGRTPAHQSVAGDGAAQVGFNGPHLGFADLFGPPHVDRLMRSADIEDRLQGLERATEAHTPETLALLLRFRDDGVAADRDPRALLALVRGLADWVERPAVRATLVGIVRDPTMFASSRAAAESEDPADDERTRGALIALAGAQAAMALASFRSPEVIKSLFEIVREGGPGRTAAAQALVTFPPEAPAELPDSLSLTTLEVITALGDLRSIDAMLTASRSNDADLSAAGLIALGRMGDVRAAETARAWRHRPEARLRVAATETLVRLGDAAATDAVEELIGRDEMAADGLRLAQDVQSEGVTRAATARAMASASPSVRLAAVAALARQQLRSALGVLASLVGDPVLAGPAAAGLARSPSRFAIGVIEELSARPGSRRLAARAYFVRRYTRGEQSARLDALLDELGQSTDGRDRAVARQAQVGLGQMSIEAAWLDRDVRVRRAVALGAMGRLDADAAAVLVRHLAAEPDEVTRIVLAGALAREDRGRALSTSELLLRVAAGKADAPLAALVLGQRDDEAARAALDTICASRDPLIRAHALRGLGASDALDATARLASAYRWEPSPDVRRAILDALAARTPDPGAGVRRRTLNLAARLEPDTGARDAARRALAGRDRAGPPVVPEVAWLALAPAEGATLPNDVTALLISSDGIGRPLAFDDDGFALLPGVRAGEAELRLAARLPPYSSGGP
jgi:HEAT repeat protein